MHQHIEHIKDYQSFRMLCENSVFLIGHIYETAYCYNKLTKQEFEIHKFIGDPTCAIISPNSDWYLVGGDCLILKKWNTDSYSLLEKLSDIHSLRAIDAYTIQILTDPWAAYSSIWQLELNLSSLIQPTRLTKIKYFTEYKNKPYTENVLW